MQKQAVNVSNYLLHPESIAEVPDNFRCVHCRELRIPVYQKMACGCRCCEPCLYQHKDKGTPCPGPSKECVSSFLISADLKSDTINVKDVFSDNAAKREILKLIIHCPFKDSGCQETGPVRHVLDTHFDKCAHKPKECQYCMQTLDTTGRTQHECPYSDRHSDLTQLISAGQRKRLPCAFVEIGCKELFANENEMKEHCTQYAVTHLQMFPAMYGNDNTDFTNENPALQEEIISIFYSRADFLASKVFNMAALHNLRDKIKKRLQESSRLPQNLLSESAGSSLPVEASSEHLLRIKSQHEQLTASLNKSGKLLWIFTDFERKQRSGTFFDSETFYTDPMGYRLRIRCYPKGNGRAMGQFFSLYFAIVHGEYDDLLKWPMRLNVTLEILPFNDSSGLLGTGSKRQTYCMGVDQEPFKKPLPNEVNTAVGNPRFLPLAELSNYLKNDKLHIQCRVARIISNVPQTTVDGFVS